MELIQGCELQGFLYAAMQARENLLRVSCDLQKLPDPDRAIVLHQYDLLNRYYGGSSFVEINTIMKDDGKQPTEFDVAQVNNNNLLARACELRLGLGISYGWKYYSLTYEGSRERYARELMRPLPTFKPIEESLSILQTPITNFLARVQIGPAMIEVPSEMLDYGIGLGLKADHQTIKATLETIGMYFE